MKPSPIQLLQVFFKHIRVEIDPERIPAEPSNPLTTAFLFDGINIQTEFGIGEVDPDHERGRMFVTTLRVLVDNQPAAESVDQKYSPYKIDVSIDGVVVLPKGAEKLGPPEDLVSVNGASLLWSAVREQVHALTARMPAGAVMLPTVHFHDLKKGLVDAIPNQDISATEVTSARKHIAGKRASSKQIR